MRSLVCLFLAVTLTSLLGVAASTAVAQSVIQDRAFVSNMAQIALAEQQYAQLAQDHAITPQARQMAARSAGDWMDTYNRLEAIGAIHGWDVPTALTAAQQSNLDALRAESGPDFDRDYQMTLIDDYSNAVAMDTDEQNSVDDALRDFAEGMLTRYIQTRDLARNNLGF